MDSSVVGTVLLLVLFSVGASSGQYCHVSQTKQGGWMRCADMTIEQLESDVTNETDAFTAFTVEWGTITEMPFKISWNSQHLDKLEIKHCRLKTIKVNAWCQYTNIKVIDFSHNELHKINDTDFKCLHTLTELYLNNNDIIDIQRNAFDELESLKKLNLSNNHLTTLDVRLPSTLTYLDISNNPLLHILQEVFQRVTKLETLKLDNINFGTIRKVLQIIPSTLTSLSMTSAIIIYLNASTFPYYPELHRLDISNNQIEQIDDNAFDSVQNVAVIFASRNHLETIPKALRSLKSLVYLDLSYNRISTYDDVLLSSFRQLRHLRISGNPLVYQKNTPIKKIDYLWHLSLDRVGIDDKSGLLGLLQEKLVEITLANNNITTVTSTMFVYCVALDRLDLSHNHISQIAEGSFSKMSPLRILNLEDNKLTEIPPRVFLRTRSLETLDLSANNLQQLPAGIFDNLSDLTWLNLSYNHDISSLHDDTFSRTTELKDLYLQGNKINNISSQLFLNTTQLERLDISNNKLDEILIGTFDSLSKLIYLNLSVNRLKTLDAFHLYDLQNLQQLYLHGNQLQSISGLEFLSRINEISLENNNWQCESLWKAVNFFKNRVVLRHAVVRNASAHHLKGIPCTYAPKELDADSKSQPNEGGGANFGYINLTLLGIILFLICCVCTAKIYKKISKNRHVNMYRTRQYSNNYKDVVKVEDENKTTSTILDEKNSLYNCYEVVE